MTEILKPIRITKEQDTWIKNRGYNFGAYVRSKIAQDIQEQEEFEKFQAAQKANRVLGKNNAEGGMIELGQSQPAFGIGFDGL